jgi:hypothetical protein
VRTLLLMTLFCLPALAAAQGAGDAPRGSTPPGLSQDGARPAEGALKGGTLAPGESGGTPDTPPGGKAPGSAAAGGSSRQLARCYELEGSLREQCLADDASKRSSGSPRAPSGATTNRRD